MASHIICEASVKGLEAKIASLTEAYEQVITQLKAENHTAAEGYRQEIAQLQAQLETAHNAKAQDLTATRATIEEVQERHATEIARLKAAHNQRMTKNEAEKLGLSAKYKEETQRLQGGMQTGQASIPAQMRALQARVEELEGQLQAAAARETADELREQVVQLKESLQEAKSDHRMTKHLSSDSIKHIREANRDRVAKLERTIAKNQGELTAYAQQVVHVQTHSSMFKAAPCYALKRCDTLKTVASLLAEKQGVLAKADIAFAVPCKDHNATRVVQPFSNTTTTTLGDIVPEVKLELRYCRKGKPLSNCKSECTLKHAA